MANRRFTQFYSTLHNKPVQLDCNFTVASTNASGITSLKGPGIANVFMHTSTTPTVGSPNPATGLIFVNLQDNYNYYYFGSAGFSSPLSGSAINISTGSSLTVGRAYVITVLGTSTTANWVAVGLPVGITPAVGVAFFASATSGTGTGQVQASSYAGVSHIEVVGDPNKTLTSSAATVLGISSGSYLVFQCVGSVFTAGAYTPAGTVAAPVLTMASYTPAGVITNGTPDTFAGTPATLTGTNSAPAFTGTAASLTGTMSYGLVTPANGTVIRLSFVLSNSMIQAQGD